MSRDQEFNPQQKIKASASYKRVGDLDNSSAGGQAKVVELVKDTSEPLWERLILGPTLYVRKSYTFGANGHTSATDSRYLWSEYQILRSLQHRNIVQYVDFEYRQRESKWTASIYMEYCRRGDLSQYTLKHGDAGKNISERQFWEIFHQLASALLYCHTGLRVERAIPLDSHTRLRVERAIPLDSHTGLPVQKYRITVDVRWKRPIIHRDIKPANVVISSTLDDFIYVKLCDFGLAKYQSSTLFGTLVGTRGYIAPEIEEDRNWSTKADIYSLGKTMQSLVCTSTTVKMEKIIEQCVNTDPKERPSNLALFEITRPCAPDEVFDFTLLHEMALNGHLAVVNRLIEIGADPKAESREGWTPLHAAAQNGHLDVVTRLLEVGADPTAVSKEGWTPLHSATRNGHLDVVNRLIEAGVDPKAELNEAWAVWPLTPRGIDPFGLLNPT